MKQRGRLVQLVMKVKCAHCAMQFKNNAGLAAHRRFNHLEEEPPGPPPPTATAVKQSEVQPETASELLDISNNGKQVAQLLSP